MNSTKIKTIIFIIDYVKDPFSQQLRHEEILSIFKDKNLNDIVKSLSRISNRNGFGKNENEKWDKLRKEYNSIVFFFHLGQGDDKESENDLSIFLKKIEELYTKWQINIFFYSGNLDERSTEIESIKTCLNKLQPSVRYTFCSYFDAKEYAEQIAEALNSSKDINPILKKIFHDHDLNMTNTINSISELNFELLKEDSTRNVSDILKKLSPGLEKKYSALSEEPEEQKEKIPQKLIKWLYAIDSLHKLRHSLVNIISPLHYTINDLDSSNSDEKRKAEEEWKELIKDSDSRPSLQKRLLAISKEWDKLAHLLDNTNSSELKKISNDLKRLIEEKLDNPSEFFKELEKLKSVYNNWLHKIESKDGNE